MTRAYFWLSVVATVAALAASLVLYPRLADEIPIHWNIQGQVDGYGSKTWAAFLMPGAMAGMLALFLALPWLSPKHFELDSFRSTYWFIVLVIMLLVAYTHGLMLWAAAAGRVDITRALLVGLLLMFGLIGNVMGKVRRNFWVGVRTPWTIANERVWNDTHRLAGKLFVAAAAIGLATLLLPLPLPAVSIAVFTLIMTAALLPVLYSLIHYKRLARRGEI
jgi:immunity protein, SdpI family